tara:strand:- start:391 stop:714 length:324 start_codon:yes stop_codon:yes gene_type:complete
MARPKSLPTLKLEAEARERIETANIIDRLNGYVLGKYDPVSMGGKIIDLSQNQVRAAIALLRKTVPDLANVEVSGKDGAAIVVEIVKGLGRDISPAMPDRPAPRVIN